YQVYEKIAAESEKIILVGCWAHARRKFFEAAKASKKTGAAHEGMKKIKELYRVEQELRGEDPEEEAFLKTRREKVEPILTAMKGWLAKKSLTVVPGSLLGKAVGYTLKQWDPLVRYLDHAGLTPDNNAAENAIRPFVLGRNYAQFRIMLSCEWRSGHWSREFSIMPRDTRVSAPAGHVRLSA
ncbi:MAG: transposase, partial [Spirochaetales bacterium]|nr:transposase [Spirochaetales bacterium]